MRNRNRCHYRGIPACCNVIPASRGTVAANNHPQTRGETGVISPFLLARKTLLPYSPSACFMPAPHCQSLGVRHDATYDDVAGEVDVW